MEKSTVRHLELIQAVVSRLAQNSFAYKGWAVALVAAIFVLATAKEMNPCFFLIALIPTIVFWSLDAYYLRQERLFRELYNKVRKAEQSELDSDPFSMNTKPFNEEVETWWQTFCSPTIARLYGPISIVIVLSAFIVFALN